MEQLNPKPTLDVTPKVLQEQSVLAILSKVLRTDCPQPIGENGASLSAIQPVEDAAELAVVADYLVALVLQILADVRGNSAPEKTPIKADHQFLWHAGDEENNGLYPPFFTNSNDIQEELVHLKSLWLLLRRRFRLLQITEAKLGIHVDPSVSTEIVDLSEKMQEVDTRYRVLSRRLQRVGRKVS
jgi:hypothetical protein